MNEVQPVKDLATLSRVSELLGKHYGQALVDVWTLGINSALRVSDLLSLKFEDLECVAGEYSIKLREQKTGKAKILDLNTKAVEIILRRKSANPAHVFIFQSNHARANGKPLSRQIVARAFKDIGELVGLQLSTHSMRKTRGYHVYKSTNNLALVQKLLNHSSSAETLRYIGLNDADVKQSYHDLVL